MSNQAPTGDPVPQQPPATTNAQTKQVNVGGEVGATGAPAQVEFGQSLPGQPPAGFPTGPDVDMYGNPRPVASEDPSQRTGDINENPPGDPPTPEQLKQMREFVTKYGA
jgi:hypothetical protein